MVSLGKTGKTLSRFGLGGFHQVEITSEIVAQVVDAFLANGGNYIETARNYGGGASEDKLGRALEGRRDQVALASKTGDRTADGARRDLEKTLDALRTDHIEFYFFHGVKPEELDTVTGKGGALEGLLQAKEEGLIDGLGLSSHRLQVYLDAFERMPLDLILIWCNYLDCLNYPIILDKIIPEAKERGIGVTAMKPLADGFLYRSVEDAVRYTLGVGAEVAICGSNSVAQVKEVAAAVREGPADEDLQAEILRDALELGDYVCRQCGICPRALMNLFRLEGVFDRQMYDYLPHNPADYALRRRLGPWFHAEEIAKKAFVTMGHERENLVAAAEEIDCPYGIDVPRKAKIAIGKLTQGSGNFV
jgi:hypothetical protein